MAAARDITERKQHEDSLREASQNAEKASHVTSDFLANMSHEIRRPMNAIIGMIRLALGKNPGAGQHSYLTKIDNAAQSLLGIINDIIDYSKIEAGKRELEQIVLSMVSGAPHHFKGDPLRLSQILVNLLNNAIKFTKRGKVIVEVKEEEGTADCSHLTFAVRDTGIGKTSEQVSNLFQFFSQADTSITRKYGGTGLGLAISKQLCELMQGTLPVESKPGIGSTFLFTATFGVAADGLPLQIGARSGDMLKKSDPVVDDSENARDVLVAMLGANGLIARAVSSGEETLSAIADASEAGQTFDLVLMD